MATPSHRLKINRANKHAHELDAMVAPLREEGEYPVVESVETYRKQRAWVYRLDLSTVQPPEYFPVVVGDYLFNVRSALDHLMVAMAPKARKRKTSFPIFTVDPLITDPATGDYLDAEEASRWLFMTKGLPANRIADLRALQPFEMTRLHAKAAEDHPLAILSTLQNADKHRELIGGATGLEKAHATIAGEVMGVVPVLKDGTVIATFPHKVEVKVEGTPIVGIGQGNKLRSFDLFMGLLAKFLGDELLPRLERYLP